jgi:hypothetical protein
VTVHEDVRDVVPHTREDRGAHGDVGHEVATSRSSQPLVAEPDPRHAERIETTYPSITSMWSQSAPLAIMRLHSEARLERSLCGGVSECQVAGNGTRGMTYGKDRGGDDGLGHGVACDCVSCYEVG